MKHNRSICIMLMLVILAGCTGQPSPYTMQMLANTQFACAQGDSAQCNNVPFLQYQAYLEAQQDAQAKNAAAAAGLLLGGVAVGVAASSGSGGYHGGGGGGVGYHGWHR
jgi:hypothetical protein